MAVQSFSTHQYPGSSLGINESHLAKVMAILHRGLEYRAMKRFQAESLLPMEAIHDVVQMQRNKNANAQAGRLTIRGRIPIRRSALRARTERLLSPDESQRLYRLARIFEQTVDLFDGDVTSASNWLTTPRKAFSHQTPLAMAKTEIGAREVEDLIGRLEHGVFS